MSDINARLSWVSSTRQKRLVESKCGLFLSPPVEGIGTLEFDRFDEVVRIGYEYAKPIIEQWAAEQRGSGMIGRR
jgi:lysophospholipid hydrolase